MRASRTLALYLAREIVQYGLAGFAAVTIVLVSQNLLRRMDALTAVGFTFDDLGVVVRCLFPMLTAYAIPVALLFGAAVAIRRLVSDSEIVAMRACGLGMRTLLVPTLAIGAAVSGISAWLLLSVEHEARRELVGLFNAVAARGSILRAGEFRGVGDQVIYVGSRDRENRIEDVMISDEAHDPPLLIFADHGRYALDREAGAIHLQLTSGELHLSTRDPSEPDPQDELEVYRRIRFERFDYDVDVGWLLTGNASPMRPKQMTLAQLREVVRRGRAGDPLEDLKKRDPVLYEIEIQRRFALPVAPFLFALAAVPLALLGAPGSRAWGPLMAVGLAFSYYAVLTFFQFLAREEWLAPWLAFWLPNALLVGLSLQLLARAQRDLPA